MVKLAQLCMPCNALHSGPKLGHGLTCKAFSPLTVFALSLLRLGTPLFSDTSPMRRHRSLGRPLWLLVRNGVCIGAALSLTIMRCSMKVSRLRFIFNLNVAFFLANRIRSSSEMVSTWRCLLSRVHGCIQHGPHLLLCLLKCGTPIT